MPPQLDLEAVRAAFPSLKSDWIFFDNAGGSAVARPVLERLEDYLVHTNVQLGASYEVSQQAGERVASARARVATSIGAASPREVVIGPSSTILARLLSTAMASSFGPGDEVILTNVDHETNIGAWLELERQGATIRWWKVRPETLSLHLDDLAGLLSERTRLVCFTHCSNVLGEIVPVAEIAQRAHEVGARVCVDGVAYAPHRALDVGDWDVDYYFFSFYKVYGPHLAALYVRESHFLELDSLNHFFVGTDQLPAKLEPGNVNYELTHAAGGIYDYLESLGRADDPDRTPRNALLAAFEAIAAQETALMAPLLEFLENRTDVRIIGPVEPDAGRRVPTISFTVAGRSSASIPEALDRRRIAVRYGDFYARRLIEDLGLAAQDGVVRVSMVHYNTLAEVEQLIRSLDEVL